MNPLDYWQRSADAWVEFVEHGDRNRELLLDPVMLQQCGTTDGLDVLDIGCGEGRFSRMLAKRGARVVGVDPTEPLLAMAARKGGGPLYVLERAESLPFVDSSFDLVVSYVSLVDIPDFRRAIREMARVLRPGGRAVIANLSSFVTAAMGGWHRGANGEKLHFPVDRYLDERGEVVDWRGIEIVNYHRPLSAYFEAFLGSGFRLKRYLEPAPTKAAVRADPVLAEQLRVPFFYVAVWKRG